MDPETWRVKFAVRGLDPDRLAQVADQCVAELRRTETGIYPVRNRYCGAQSYPNSSGAWIVWRLLPVGDRCAAAAQAFGPAVRWSRDSNGTWWWRGGPDWWENDGVSGQEWCRKLLALGSADASVRIKYAFVKRKPVPENRQSIKTGDGFHERIVWTRVGQGADGSYGVLQNEQ